MADAWGSSWGVSSAWGNTWAAGTVSTTFKNLKVLSLKLSDKLSLSISVTGDTIPISLLAAAPSGAPPAGRGLVAYIDSGTLKLAAWTGSAWVTT